MKNTYTFSLVSNSTGVVSYPLPESVEAEKIDALMGERSALSASISLPNTNSSYLAQITEDTDGHFILFHHNGAYSEIFPPEKIILNSNDYFYIPFIPRDISGRLINLSSPSVIFNFGDSSYTHIPSPGDIITEDSIVYLIRIPGQIIPSTVSSIGYSINAPSMKVISETIAFSFEESKIFVKLTKPISGVTVSFTDTSNITKSVQTDTNGEAVIYLTVGDYSVVLDKPGYIFSENNQIVSITESSTDIILNAEYSIKNTHVPEGFCNIFFQLLSPDGTPKANHKVIFTPISPSGSVLNTPLIVRTDFEGRGSVNLIYGLEVKVIVEGVRSEKTFVVPEKSSEDLFNLISLNPSTPEVYYTSLPTGVRRTLDP